jgi:predicted SAM-dependent methyltransferase
LEKKLKLDLGSGHVRLAGWKRVDIDPEADADYKITIQEVGTCFGNNSIEEIRAYHVLEHISPKDVFPTMRGWWKVLKPHGKITIEVPDCHNIMLEYARGHASWAEVKRILLGADPDATEWMVHRNFFNSGMLKRFFMITGFVNIQHDREKACDVVNMTAFKPGMKTEKEENE